MSHHRSAECRVERCGLGADHNTTRPEDAGEIEEWKRRCGRRTSASFPWCNRSFAIRASKCRPQQRTRVRSCRSFHTSFSPAETVSYRNREIGRWPQLHVTKRRGPFDVSQRIGYRVRRTRMGHAAGDPRHTRVQHQFDSRIQPYPIASTSSRIADDANPSHRGKREDRMSNTCISGRTTDPQRHDSSPNKRGTKLEPRNTLAHLRRIFSPLLIL